MSTHETPEYWHDDRGEPLPELGLTDTEQVPMAELRRSDVVWHYGMRVQLVGEPAHYPNHPGAVGPVTNWDSVALDGPGAGRHWAVQSIDTYTYWREVTPGAAQTEEQ